MAIKRLIDTSAISAQEVFHMIIHKGTMPEERAWLRLSIRDRIYAASPNRLEAIEEKLPQAKREEQYPSVLFFIGGRSRTQAVRELFPYHKSLYRRNREKAFVELDVDISTANSRYPLYLAESDPHDALDDDSRKLDYCRVKHLQTCWEPHEVETAVNELYSGLFFLFADVVCIFADDFPSYKDVVQCIARWINRGSASSLVKGVRPRVLVVTRNCVFPTQASRPRSFEVEDLQALIGASVADLRRTFCSVHLVTLSKEDSLIAACYRSLKDLVIRQVDEARARRETERVLFSSAHLSAFFSRRFAQLNDRKIPGRFNFIEASRKDNEVRSDYAWYLTVFVKLAMGHRTKMDDVASVIASSMLMNAYPAKMHPFNPDDVFMTLYRSRCLTGLKDAYPEPPMARYMCKLIRHYFIEHFVWVQCNYSLPAHHRDTVAELIKEKYPRGWFQTKSDVCCLICINAKPEHVLFCGHSLCDNCVKSFGAPLAGLEHGFRVDDCLFCKDATKPLTVHLKPPSAGVRGLLIDGGGIKGIMPLEYIRLLQEDLGTDCLVQDLFDLVIGTSAGGFIVIGLWLLKWHVSKCIETFTTLSKSCFGKGRSFSSAKFQQVQRLFKGLISDGMYDVKTLERALRDSFGDSRKIFSYPVDGISKFKVGVTATTTGNDPFLFASYNGAAERKDDTGYRHHRSTESKGEPYIWEA